MVIASRVKSLSKGNNPKKDVLGSTLSLKESTTVPLSSIANASNFEDDMSNSWPEQNGGDDYDVSEELYEQEIVQQHSKKNNGRQEPSFSTLEDKFQKSNFQSKWKDMQKSDANNSHMEDYLDVLLQA